MDTDYTLLLREAEAMTAAEPHMIPTLANLSALLKQHLDRVNWVGFYLVTAEGDLRLGPFQGKIACVRIARGKGVCGTALEQGRTQRVDDVHAFPGHIACDAASRSELVVPVRDAAGNIRALLDIDSPEPARFTPRDGEGMEALCAMLSGHVVWEL